MADTITFREDGSIVTDYDNCVSYCRDGSVVARVNFTVEGASRLDLRMLSGRVADSDDGITADIALTGHRRIAALLLRLYVVPTYFRGVGESCIECDISFGQREFTTTMEL